MRTMTVLDAKNDFSRALRCAAKDVVIITRHGRPVAALQGLTEEDVEDFLLERSETFWKMIRKARKGKSVPIEAVRRRLKM